MEKEKVLLVVVDFEITRGWRLEDIGQELEELVSGCRGQVVETVFCRLDRPSATYLIGEGKVQEIAEKAAALEVDTVVVSHDLKGSHQRNLEEALKVKIIDRTQLILDIFARHATSQEGKLQVELAQLEYLLPRLVGKGILLSRLGGGIGTLGPGETKLEVDRRRIGQRISKLRKQLEDMKAGRILIRKKRSESGVPTVSIVGYTNAGKTTLFNKLTESEQLTRESLFTTLDSITRQFILPNHQKIVISDTVGFMQDLPHHLIESFKATLEQVSEADLILHVLDISNPNYRNLYEAVINVLKELDARDKPVLTVLNKIDKLTASEATGFSPWRGDAPRAVLVRGVAVSHVPRTSGDPKGRPLTDKTALEDIQARTGEGQAVSALTGENLPALIEKITAKLSSVVTTLDLKIPINRMDLVNLAHKEGRVISIKYHNKYIKMQATVPSRIAQKFLQADSEDFPE